MDGRVRSRQTGGFWRRKCPKKSRSLIYDALGPDASSMPVDNSVDRCKPYARSWEPRLLVKALERSKEPFSVGHIEPCPVVTDEVGRDAVGLGESELDDRLSLACAELPGISQQVLEHDLQKTAVSLGDHSTHDQRLDLPLRAGLLEFRGNGPGQL